MKCLVRLEGPEEGLNELSQFLKNIEDVRIFKEGDFYYVESNQLDNIKTYDEASDKAKLILAEIKGIAQLLLLWNIPITIGAMRRPDKNGVMQDIVQKECTFCIRSAQPRTITHNQKKVELVPEIFFPNFIHLAKKDDFVLYVLQMVDYAFGTWWGLFCIIEAIDNDARGYKNLKWMNQKERSRFRATAQDRRLIGKYSRHGYKYTGKIEKNPMTFLEAQKFVWDSVIKWLLDKY